MLSKEWGPPHRYVISNLETHLEPWFERAICRSPGPGLLEFLTQGRSTGFPPKILHDDELDRLESLTRFLQVWPQYWMPLEGVHDLSASATAEIRKRMSEMEAERWAVDSADFAEELRSELPVHVGIVVVRKWLAELRKYLLALGELQYLPAPEGGFPTPTHSARPTGNNANREKPKTGLVATETPSDPSSLLDGLPQELTVTEAAEILGCDRKTVLAYINCGQVKFRNVAPQSSTRAKYVLLAESVLELRTSHGLHAGEPPTRTRPSRARKTRRKPERYQPKHLKPKT